MSVKQKFQIHARLAKYNEDDHTFEAVATDETIDKTMERMHYERSAPHFKDWASEFSKATDGKSVGNLRSMHGKVAAGLLKSLVCDDDAKAIIIRGEVVDPTDQAKMAKGVYTGVSIGGDFVEKWPDTENKGVFWYEAKPFEVSLVDNPCNPNARFMKSVGGVEAEVPLTGDLEKAAALAAEEAEKAAVAKLAEIFDARTVLPSALLKLAEAELNKGAEAASAEKRADLKKALMNPDITFGDVEALAKAWLPEGERTGDVPALLGALFKAGGFSPEELTEIEQAKPDAPLPSQEAAGAPLAFKSAEDVAKALKRVQTLGEPAKLMAEKGLYGLCTLAQLLEQLHWCARDAMAEAAYEGDSSMVPAKLKMVCAELGDILCEMAEEETQEEANKAIVSGSLSKALEKAGARHSAKDASRLQNIHDHSVDMGAKCAASAKSIGSQFHKLLGVTDDAGFEKALGLLRDKAEKWDKQPVRKGALRAIAKGQDTSEAQEDEVPAAVVEKVRAARSGDGAADIWLIHKGYAGGSANPAFEKIK